MDKNKDKCTSKKERKQTLIKKEGIMHWIWLAAAIGYTLSPLDLVPDTFPVLGWLDDLSLLSAAILNLFQHYNENTHKQIAKILRYLKWIFLLLAILMILIFGLLGYLVFFKN